MKDFKTTINYNGKALDLVFDLNVMEQLQDEFGSVEAWGDLTSPDPEDVLDPITGAVIGSKRKEPDISAFLFGFTAMLNEGIDMANEDGGNRPMFTKKQVGRIITAVGMDMATQAMQKVVTDSTETDAGKNA